MPVTVNCVVCASAFQVKPSHAEKRKCCTKTCLAEYFKTSLKGKNNPNWRECEPLTCMWCLKPFRVMPCFGHRKICSSKCGREWSSSRRGDKSSLWRGGPTAKPTRAIRTKKPERVWVPCLQCGALRSVVNKPARCSQYCKGCRDKANAYRAGRDVTCPQCGNCRRVWPKDGNRSGLCGKCYAFSLVGPKNPHWKGGITPHSRKIRASEEYISWRKSVFARDGYNCQICWQHGGSLHAHHLKPFSSHPELRLEVSNGQTLCVACHRKTDTFLSNHKRTYRSKFQAEFCWEVGLSV